ncbi:hypothetical protein ACFL4B_00015 [Candidatus Neomarinimicrobiota bacterium]
MRKILILNILLLILFSCKTVENTKFPNWIDELRLNVSKTLHTEVNISHIKITDNITEGKYFIFCLKGKSDLEKGIDPFEKIDEMFSSSGWKYIAKYQADGHGSTSFAYEKGDYFCNIFINIDSSCDDEKTKHIPSKYWFEIFCREK